MDLRIKFVQTVYTIDHMQKSLFKIFSGINCRFLWTGGFAVVSGSNDNWMWNMSTHTEPIDGYAPWKGGEPNNFQGRKEDAIIIDVSVMTIEDISPDVTGYGFASKFVFCHICEYN